MQTPIQSLPGGLVHHGEGRKFNVLGQSVTAIFSQQTTQGNYYVFEVITPPGLGVPPHVHQREDELIYLVEGELEVMLGGQKFLARAGDNIFFPRNVAHAFHNAGSQVAKCIFTVVPGGNFEEFFDKLAALPPGEPDITVIIGIFAQYGMKVLLPESA